jgi:hypothetical protein
LASELLTPDYKFDQFDPTFTFDPLPHVYMLMGKQIPSTSAILAPYKPKYQPDPMYAHRGTIVHMACHYLDDGGVDHESVVKDYRGYVDAYRKFKEEWKFIPRLNEKPMYHPELRYGVTPDKDGTLTFPKSFGNGKDAGITTDAIVELKSGVMYRWVALQTMSQKMALERWDRVPRKRVRLGIRLNVDGTYEETMFVNDEVDTVVWKSMVIAAHAAPDYF